MACCWNGLLLEWKGAPGTGGAGRKQFLAFGGF
jgi:hypothetical protein